MPRASAGLIPIILSFIACYGEWSRHDLGESPLYAKISGVLLSIGVDAGPLMVWATPGLVASKEMWSTSDVSHSEVTLPGCIKFKVDRSAVQMRMAWCFVSNRAFRSIKSTTISRPKDLLFNSRFQRITIAGVVCRSPCGVYKQIFQENRPWGFSVHLIIAIDFYLTYMGWDMYCHSYSGNASFRDLCVLISLTTPEYMRLHQHVLEQIRIQGIQESIFDLVQPLIQLDIFRPLIYLTVVFTLNIGDVVSYTSAEHK